MHNINLEDKNTHRSYFVFQLFQSNNEFEAKRHPWAGSSTVGRGVCVAAMERRPFLLACNGWALEKIIPN